MSAALVAVGTAGASVAAWSALGSPGDTTASAVVAPTPTRVAIRAHASTADGPAWLVTATERLARRRLAARVDRAYWLDDQTPDVVVELAVRRAGRGVELVATDGGRELGRATAPSVIEALDTLGPGLNKTLDAGRPPAGPDAAERDGIAQTGAPDVTAYREWMNAYDGFFRLQEVDNAPTLAALTALDARYPTWPHLAAMRALADGQNTAEDRAAFAAAVSRADPARDGAGLAALRAEVRVAEGGQAGGIAIVTAGLAMHPRDPLLVLLSTVYQCQSHLLDDCISVQRLMYERYPALQFGADLGQTLRRAGRLDEAHTVVVGWAAAHPESEQALLERIQLAIAEEHPDEARALLPQAALLFGEPTDRLGFTCQVNLALGDLAAAHQVAERMIRASSSVRASGRFRLGEIAIFEERFASAYTTLKQAVTENEPLGTQSRMTQVLGLLVSTAPLAGQPGDERMYGEQLARAESEFDHDATAPWSRASSARCWTTTRVRRRTRCSRASRTAPGATRPGAACNASRRRAAARRARTS